MPNWDELKKMNGALTTLNEPYAPIVYAIPKEQWEAMLNLQTGMVL